MKKPKTSPKKAVARLRAASKARPRKTSQHLGALPPPPVVPAPQLLPLADTNISWKRFEQFCRTLVSKLPNVKRVVIYGKQGNRQRGIDLVAYLVDGTRTTYQCRQTKNFTGANVKKTVDKTTYRGATHHVIVTSAEADVTARDEIDRNAGWELWDVGDVSERVRELSPHIAAGVVEDSFGVAWRRAFLGLGPVRSFQRASDAFAALLEPKSTFTHAHALVARSDVLGQLEAFVGSKALAMVVAGRGGIGKTRLLLELGMRIDQAKWETLWLEESAPITESALEGLSPVPTIIVVDDAHRRDDLGLLFVAIRQRRLPTKIILGTRPHSTDRLRNDLLQAKFSFEEIAAHVEIGELASKDIAALARSILGASPSFAGLDERIAQISTGSPLVATIAAALVRDKAIAPEVAQRETAFAQLVLSRFEDERLGVFASTSQDRAFWYDLLGLIAALAPLAMHREAVLDRVASRLGVSRSRLFGALDELETKGVLVRRGRTVRIAPDVLSDHVLESRALTTRGEPTGYASELVADFGSVALIELIRNFAELDWRIQRSGATSASPIEDVWRAFEERVRSADEFARNAYMEVLEDVSYLQPTRALDFVRRTLRAKGLDTVSSPVRRSRIPRMLARIAHTIELLPECLDHLLALVKEDPGEHDGAPRHELLELAGYAIRKPLVVNSAVLDAIDRWLVSNDGDLLVALKIVKPMLDKTFSHVVADRKSMSLQSVSVPVASVTALRHRVRLMLAGAIKSSRLKAVVAAVAMLGEDAADPQGLYGHVIGDADRNAWTKERLDSLEILLQAIVLNDDVVNLAIRDAIMWHASYSHPESVRERAKAILEKIPDTFELRFARVLQSPAPDDRTVRSDFREQVAEWDVLARETASEFVERFPAARDGLAASVQRLERASEWRSPHPVTFFAALVRVSPDYAAEFLELAMEQAATPVLVALPTLFIGVRHALPQRAASVMPALLRGSSVARRAFAQSLAGCIDGLTADERHAWSELLADEDEMTRRAALTSLQSLTATRPREALDFALRAPRADDEHELDELCMLVQSARTEVVEADVRALLKVIGDAKSIGGYWIAEFIGDAAKQLPRETARMLISRVERGREPDSQPIPFTGFGGKLAAFSESAAYREILQDLIALVSKGGASAYWCPRLFREIARFDVAATGALISEAISASEAAHVEPVATLIAGLSGEVLRDNAEIVIALLRAANLRDNECRRSVEELLRHALVPSSWSSAVGVADPKVVIARERTNELAASLPSGSAERAFFERVVREIDATIKRALEDDEEDD